MKKTLLIACCVRCITIAQAQSIDRQVVANGGSFASNSSASVSYTVGEMAIQYVSASSASLSQGFQQTGGNNTDIHTIQPIDATISTYPNPFIHFVAIKSDRMLASAAFKLVDVNGKSIPVQVVETQQSQAWQIQTGDLAAGNYWLTITSGIYQSNFSLTHTMSHP
jgi:hypothetical protein